MRQTERQHHLLRIGRLLRQWRHFHCAARVNTDLTGGIVVLAIALIFHAQMSEDITMFGAFFPKKIVPLLDLTGGLLVARGLIWREKSKKLVFQINGTMLLVMVIGAIWALTMPFLGFIATGFLALSALVAAYLPEERRNPATLFLNWTGVLALVLAFYYLFTRFLGVTLPVGKLFDAFL